MCPLQVAANVPDENSMPPPSWTGAAILDIDGTLLDSNDAHASAFVDAARELGLAAEFQTVRRLIGKGGDKLVPEAFGISLESDLGKRLDKLKGRIFRDRYVETLRPTPGARGLLERFRAEGLRRVVATSAKKDQVDELLERAGIRDLVERTVSAEDVDESKPEPDVVLAAIEKTGLPRESIFMLGDTPYDIQAARAAGIRTVGVRSGGWPDDRLAGAVAIFDDPADILAHYDSFQRALREGELERLRV